MCLPVIPILNDNEDGLLREIPPGKTTFLTVTQRDLYQKEMYRISNRLGQLSG